MRQSVLTLIWALALSGLTIAANAIPPGYIVVWHDDFQTVPLGPYPPGPYPVWNFAGTGNPRMVITNDLPLGTNTQNLALLFDVTNGVGLNFGMGTDYLRATNNTLPYPAAYTLVFDMAVRGVDVTNLGGLFSSSFGLFGAGSGPYYGTGMGTNPPVSIFPAAGAGYQHYEWNLGSLSSSVTHNGTLIMTGTNPFSFFIGLYLPDPTNTLTEEIDFGDVYILMNTNYAPPGPTMNILSAQPGLRIFAEDATAPWNVEGFSSVDNNQSWVGAATPSAPVRYSMNIQDFDTISGYNLSLSLVQNGTPGPYVLYLAENVMQWGIVSGGGTNGFQTYLSWKTNAPTGGETSNVVTMVTTSTNGRGPWTLSWTSDTDGSITAPDGSSTNFSIAAANIANEFTNPVNINIGTAPNSTAGYGQFIDFNSILVTNVLGVNESTDFTKEGTFKTNWNPAFSISEGGVHCIVQVPPNAAYWITWTVPADGFGLATKADLSNTNIPWYSPWYYSGYTAGGYAVSNAPWPMGGKLYWVLIPSSCLPTVDGTTNGPVSSKGFFRLQNPPPSR